MIEAAYFDQPIDWPTEERAAEVFCGYVRLWGLEAIRLARSVTGF
jgi:hypothetical protein